MSPRKTTILHVEDHRSLQNLVRIALETLGGYTVLTAGDAYQALAMTRDAAPDLLLLDLDLPGMNGIATLRALREMRGITAPAVFLTASNDPAVDLELQALGVREVLRKPLRPRQLVQAIERALRLAAG
jgi:two-component system, OmpR family, response regulator